MTNILQNLPDDFDSEIIKQLLKDRKALIAATQRDFFLFFYIYFGRYIKRPIAPFHFEMFRIAQDEEIKRAGVMTFRNSAKSTILNTAYSLWAIMGTSQKKHVVIASQTQQRSKDHLMNIRKEIENNQLLSENLGPFSVGEDRWGATILIVPAYKARISAISVEEGIRGLKEGPDRPDLIVADDIEDSSSIKTREVRDKTFNWFTGELIPLGEIDTKIIVLGNFLCQDSVLFRLEEMINEGKMKGVFLRVPLVDENNKIAWPGKFPSLKAIEEFKQSIGNEITWQRDFLLRAVPDDYQIIHFDWIQFYDALPSSPPRYTFTAVDPAMSKKESADCTAMVSAYVYGEGEDLRIYILSNPINKRGMEFSEMLERMREFSRNLGGGSHLSKVFIEEVALQAAPQIQTLQKEGYPIEGIRPGSTDKRTRLMTVSNVVQTGKVLFPRKGAETLIQQIVFFGLERYDDLADAFSMLIGQIMVEENRPSPSFTWLDTPGPRRRMGLLSDEEDSEGWRPFP